MTTMSTTTIEPFKTLSSSIISDALDRAGVQGTIEGIATVVPGKVMCGPAFTVRYVLHGPEGGRYADFLDEVPADSVVAIDNAGRMDCSVWGDTLTLFAVMNRFAGAVIDGVCRDIDGTREHGFPMFARGVFMRTGKGRVVIDSLQGPITLGKVVVRPGDLLFGDETGVVAIPADRTDEILALAQQTVRKDETVAASIRSGASLIDSWRAGALALSAPRK